MLDDFSPHDASARLWPQTERLKAAALAARLGEPRAEGQGVVGLAADGAPGAVELLGPAVVGERLEGVE